MVENCVFFIDNNQDQKFCESPLGCSILRPYPHEQRLLLNTDREFMSNGFAQDVCLDVLGAGPFS
jgi:hypothetical protein